VEIKPNEIDVINYLLGEINRHTYTVASMNSIINQLQAKVEALEIKAGVSDKISSGDDGTVGASDSGNGNVPKLGPMGSIDEPVR